jgi:hypothetical protein
MIAAYHSASYTLSDLAAIFASCYVAKPYRNTTTPTFCALHVAKLSRLPIPAANRQGSNSPPLRAND